MKCFPTIWHGIPAITEKGTITLLYCMDTVHNVIGKAKKEKSTAINFTAAYNVVYLVTMYVQSVYLYFL